MIIVVDQRNFTLSPFENEGDIINWFVSNVSSSIFPGYIHISSEVVLDGYRLDCILYNPTTAALMIVEIKCLQSPGLIEQALAYLNVAKRSLKSLKFDIANTINSPNVPVSSVNVLVVSQAFTNHQIEMLSHGMPFIKLMQVTRYVSDNKETIAVNAELVRSTKPKAIIG